MSTETKTNTLNCFNLRNWFILIFMILLCALPFLSILMIRIGGGYNVINWEQYYYNKENYAYNTTGTFVSYSNYSTDQQLRIKDGFYVLSVPTGSGNTTKNITYGASQYQFIINGSSDIEFITQYTFPKKTIYHYYPFLYGLPLSIPIGKNTSYYDTYFHETRTNRTIEKGDYIIPSNWNDVWDNIEIIFYYVDANNNGIGIEYGNNQSETYTTHERIISTHFGELNLNVLPINVSGDFYNKTITIESLHTNDSIMVTRYHSLPFSNDTFISNYISDTLGFGVDNIEDGLNAFLPTTVSIGDNAYSYIEYDNTVFEIRQLQGFPNWYEYPSLSNAEKCGFYIKVNKEFDITQYFSMYYDTNDMNNLFESGEFLMNGIVFWDGGLYLGKMETMIQAIERVFIYDLVIIFGSISGLIVIALFINYPQKEDDFKKLKQKSCIIE